MPPRLTDRRREILVALARLTRALGRPVTIQELAAELGLTKQSMREHLQALEQLGLLTRSGGRYGLLHLTSLGQGEADQASAIPLVGEVAAGPPVFAEPNVDLLVTHLADLLDLKEGDFLLRVRGDSMTGVGIYDGDAVVIRPTGWPPPNGEIVLVHVLSESTTTLKRFYLEGDQVRLVSENPGYGPMLYPAENIVVQGCFAGIVGAPRARRFAGPEGR